MSNKETNARLSQAGLRENNQQRIAPFFFVFLAGVCVVWQPSYLAAQHVVVNLASQDLAYSPINDVLYATVPNGSPINPNTLTPINPTTGALGTPIAIGFNPRDVVISNDGTTLHVVFGGNVAVQPYDVPSQTFGTAFFLTGGPQVKQIVAIPDRPTAVLVSTHMPGFSPPATGTAVWENSVRLQNVVGTGLGSGGPDLICVDPVDGTRGYGYQNTVTSYTNWNLNIDANGVDSGGGPTLQGLLTGGVGRIERNNGRVFTNRGEVYNISPPFQSGAFQRADVFILDPGTNKLYSVETVNDDHILRAYDLTNLQYLCTHQVSGVSGIAKSLTRIEPNGLAFRTTDDNIVLLPNTALVEATSTLADSVSVTTGSLDSGGLPELCTSDDQYMVLDPAFSMFRYQLDFTVCATAPTDTPTTFEFTYESHIFNLVGNVGQIIQLYNFDTDQFETVDSRNATLSDTSVTVMPSGDLSRFVQPKTLSVKARIKYQNNLPFWVFVITSLYLPYETSVDHISWSIAP